MSHKKEQSAEERRKALKKILAGTGAAGVVAVAPEKWASPVISSVILPGHAQTSLSLNYSDPSISATASTNLLESLIPAAHAGAIFPDSLCINFNPDMTTYNASIQDGNQFNVENGEVGIAETILDFNCDAPIAYTLKVLNGPDLNGVAWEIRLELDVAPIQEFEGVAQASDCIVDLGACLD